jgi:hypothetical protein
VFRFSIRDVLWLTVVVGMGIGWWVDHSRLMSAASQWRIESIKLAMRLIPLESMALGSKRIGEILESAEKSPPPPEVAAEIIQYVRHDNHYRNRICAMLVLPYLTEREEAVNVLVDAIRERDGKRTGNGTVPLYAARMLADMKATSAIDEVKGWLSFLKDNSPFDDETRSLLIESAERNLAKLEDAKEAQHPQ